MKRVYFKSFRKRESNAPLESTIFDSETKSLSTCQTLDEVLNHNLLKTNTHHHILANRLSVSLPTNHFPGVYRPEGVLFTTNQRPSYCLPFDLMALTKGTKFSHEDYGSDFLEGYENFVFPDFESMSRDFPNSRQAITALNDFRESHGLNPIEQEIDYNELCFEQDVEIRPVALVGESPEIKNLAWRYKIKNHDSMEAYLHPIKHELTKMFYLGLASQFDGYQGLVQERECDFVC